MCVGLKIKGRAHMRINTKFEACHCVTSVQTKRVENVHCNYKSFVIKCRMYLLLSFFLSSVLIPLEH